MVYFVCGVCQESLKKNQVNRHCETVCPHAWTFTCVDCAKEFHGMEFDKHTSCITEAQKFKITPHKKPIKQTKWRGWRWAMVGKLKRNGEMEIDELREEIVSEFMKLGNETGFYSKSDADEIFNIKTRSSKFTISKDKGEKIINLKNGQD